MPDQSPRRPHAKTSLLAFSVLVLTLLALEFGTLLDPFSWWSDKEIASSRRDPNRYMDERHFKALSSFEGAILIQPENPEPPAPWHKDDLLTQLPQCAGEWNKTPGKLDQLNASLMDRLLDLTPPAERIAMQLNMLDTYLRVQGESGNRKLSVPAYLDRSRWYDSVRYALEHEFSPDDFPEIKLRVRCGDYRRALRTLMPNACRQALLLIHESGLTEDRRKTVIQQCRALENLAWRETTPKVKTQLWDNKRQAVSVPANLIYQYNPWGGQPGCIYWNDAAQGQRIHYLSNQRNSNRTVCEHPKILGREVSKDKAPEPIPASGSPLSEALNDPAWAIPPSLPLMLRKLERLRQPASDHYQRLTSREDRSAKTPELYGTGPNKLSIGGTSVDVGFSVDLTIDAKSQAIAQQVAACYTGDQKVCRALNIQRVEDKDGNIGHALLENAVVRVAGIAIIDIPTGRIEALAGSLSPCTREDYDGPGRSANCDQRLPWQPRYSPDNLENPAVFLDAMPASTVKPILAAGFLSDEAYRKKIIPRELRRELQRSNSEAFLSRMFCMEKNGENCERPWVIQKLLPHFGWNAECTEGSSNCGKQDLLFGLDPSATAESGLIRPLMEPVLFGRLMVTSTGPGDPRFSESAKVNLDPQAVLKCARGPDKIHGNDDDWSINRDGDIKRTCRGGEMIRLRNEGYGQGNARSSALGVAGMMAVLGGAANGEAGTAAPHLVSRVHGTEGEVRLAHQRYDLDKKRTQSISQETAQMIIGGLALSHRNDGTAASGCTQVHSKETCDGLNWIAGKTGTPTFIYDEKPLSQIEKDCAPPKSCDSRPYKWYTAVYRKTPESKSWDKAIAVLTERNWQKKNGKVHGPGDTGSNPSAEIAFQITGRLLGQIPWGQEEKKK